MTPEIRNSREADPYWHWAMAREAGDAGRRPEIIHQTFPVTFSLIDGYTPAQQLAERKFGAAATCGIHYYDRERRESLNPPFDR